MTVVTSGGNIQNPTINNSIMNSKIPFTKLDTRNIESFQTISLLFDHEPPQPASLGANTQTLVYSFPHDYTYIPSIWLMWQNDSPEFPALPALSDSATTYYPFGDDTISNNVLNAIYNGTSSQGQLAYVVYNSAGSFPITTSADLFITVDTKNVYIYLMKRASATIGGNVIPLFMAGVTLDIRCYVFAEPASTSTY